MNVYDKLVNTIKNLVFIKMKQLVNEIIISEINKFIELDELSATIDEQIDTLFNLCPIKSDSEDNSEEPAIKADVKNEHSVIDDIQRTMHGKFCNCPECESKKESKESEKSEESDTTIVKVFAPYIPNVNRFKYVQMIATAIELTRVEIDKFETSLTKANKLFKIIEKEKKGQYFNAYRNMTTPFQSKLNKLKKETEEQQFLK